MGIGFNIGREDSSDDDYASWSYTGFHVFRKRLAESIGLHYEEMEGFGGSTPWGTADRDDLFPLLNHSDCDGELSPSECATVAPRLREVIAGWKVGLGDIGHDYDRRTGLALADMMDKCAKRNKPLVFC